MSVVTLGAATDKLVQDIDERMQRGGVEFVGLPTGYVKLDAALGGFRKKGHYFLGGRMGSGKSSLAQGIAYNIAKHDVGKTILYASFEMSAELLSLRMLSNVTNIPSMLIEQGRLTPEQFATIKRIREEFHTMQFYIIDTPLSTEELAKTAIACKEKKGLDFMVIDYLSLFTDRGDSEVQRLEGVVGRTTALTSVLDIPTLSLIQLNRGTDESEGNYPTLKNIRYSDRIGYDAFAVFFVHRPAYFDRDRGGEDCEDDALILLEKNRQGPTGHLNARFYPKTMRWEQKDAVPTPPPPTSVKTVKPAKSNKEQTLAERVREGR